MQILLSSYVLLAFSAMVSSSPLHRHRSGMRHTNDPQKRYVVNGLFTEPALPQRRHEQSAANNEAQQTRTVSSIDPFAVPTRQGTEDGRAPAVGVGGSNTSLLSLLTQSLTETARAQSSAQGQGAQQNGAPSVAGSGTAINPAGAADVSTTTVQLQTTVLETVQVTVQATASALSSATAPLGEATAQPQQPATQSAEQQTPATVTVVFVTADPTFTGSTAGFSTLDTTANTATASDVVAAAATTTTNTATASDVIAAAATTTTALTASTPEAVRPPQPTTVDAPIANSQLLGLGEGRAATTTLASTTTEVIAATAAAVEDSSSVSTSTDTSTSTEDVAAATAAGAEPTTVTIRPGLSSIPATEARPTILSTASTPPESEITASAAPSSTAAVPVPVSDSVTLAVVPVTIETVQQNQNAFTVTETQTVTTTVTAV